MVSTLQFFCFFVYSTLSPDGVLFFAFSTCLQVIDKTTLKHVTHSSKGHPAGIPSRCPDLVQRPSEVMG